DTGGGRVAVAAQPLPAVEADVERRERGRRRAVEVGDLQGHDVVARCPAAGGREQVDAVAGTGGGARTVDRGLRPGERRSGELAVVRVLAGAAKGDGVELSDRVSRGCQDRRAG